MLCIVSVLRWVGPMNSNRKRSARLQELLAHDFLPWANPVIHAMMRPLTVLVLTAIVALTCALLVNPMAFIPLAFIVVVVILGCVWPRIAVRGLSVQAEFLQMRCRPGDTVTVVLRVRNRFPIPAWGLTIGDRFDVLRGQNRFPIPAWASTVKNQLDDSELGGSSDESAQVTLACVNAWSEIEYEWLFSPSQRGVFPIGTPQATTGFPFGLIHASVPMEVKNELVVWPKTVDLDTMPDVAEIQMREDQTSDRRAGHVGSMIGVRPFRDGDSLRCVHWAQTARQGKMIVVERQSPASCAVRLLVDAKSESHSGSGESYSLESVLTLAASILELMHRQHSYVELVIDGQVLSVDESQFSFWQAMDRLARVPRNGTGSVESCIHDRPSRMLPTISVTTDRSLSKHRRHRHINVGERHVVVGTSSKRESNDMPSDCDCHAWIELKSDEAICDVFPDRWRRACNAF